MSRIQNPSDTKLAYLTYEKQQAAEAIFLPIITAGYKAARANAELRHFEQTGEHERFTIAGPTTPVEQIQAAFDALPADQKAIITEAGRFVYAQHAADGEPLSDDEAYLTVLAGCTEWDKWEQRGGGCHWHGEMYPDRAFICTKEGCEGWAELDYDVDVETPPANDAIVAECEDCDAKYTWADFKATVTGQEALAAESIRDAVLTPYIEQGLLEPFTD